MGHGRDLDKFIDEARASQRNIVFPDTVRNARSADVFLWNGSPDPSLVQRIAAWIFGLAYMGIALEVFFLAVTRRVKDGFSIDIVILAAMSLSAVLIGIRIFRNGFPRRAKQARE